LKSIVHGNLHQHISVIDSVHLTAKITLFLSQIIHPWTVVRPNLLFMMPFAMAARDFAQGHKSRQRVFRTQSNKAAVAIFDTRFNDCKSWSP